MKMKNLIEILLRQKISINQYIYLSLIEEGELQVLKEYLQNRGFLSEKEFDGMVNKGYLKPNSPILPKGVLKNQEVTTEFKNLKKVINGDNINKVVISTWFDEWYNLFPSNVESGNYKIKSKRGSCKLKLSRFMKKHPKYNKDIILKATKLYIDEFRLRNFEYIQLAANFIYKKEVNNSTLEDYCERIINGEESIKKPGVGERTL